MGDKLIELRDVTFYYGKRIVLEDINFIINEGDFWAVIGPNGGGKTTLLKIILGILKPNKGSVIKQVRGHDGCFIGYLPQVNYNNQFPLTVLDAVLMGIISSKHKGFKFSKTEIERAEETLELVQMADFSNRPFKDLSGGQQQRVLIARALISKPKVLLLDEPTSNIDPQSKFCFYDFLSELNSKITIIMVSHDLSLTLAKVTNIACVNRWMITSKGEFTKEMYELLYGIHTSHSCPLNQHIYQDSEDIFFRR